MIPIYLRHRLCGRELSIAVLQHDAALYVYCDHCRDIVEDGEIDPPIDEDKVRLRIDEERVRPMLTDGDTE